MAQKSNNHNAPQPYTNQSVFKSLLNYTSEISLSDNATGREFQRHGPATEKLPSPRRIRSASKTSTEDSSEPGQLLHSTLSRWGLTQLSYHMTPTA